MLSLSPKRHNTPHAVSPDSERRHPPPTPFSFRPRRRRRPWPPPSPLPSPPPHQIGRQDKREGDRASRRSQIRSAAGRLHPHSLPIRSPPLRRPLSPTTPLTFSPRSAMARRPPPWPCGCCSSSSQPRCTQAAPNPSRLHRSIKGLLFIISNKMAAASSSGVRAGFHRAEPVIIDPGHYADMFWTPQRRSMTTAFKLFTGFHMAKPVIIDPGSTWTCSGYHSAGAFEQPSRSSPVFVRRSRSSSTRGSTRTCSGNHSAGACLQPSSSSPVISKKQHKLITAGAAVLNLGCTPDTWLQVALPEPRAASMSRAQGEDPLSALRLASQDCLCQCDGSVEAANPGDVNAGFHRAKLVIIDPGLYVDVFWMPQRRSFPTSFKLFTGWK